MFFMHDSHHKKVLLSFFIVFLIAGATFLLINHQTAEAPTTDTSSYGRVEVEGTTECLPKKDTGGAVTLECAIGLGADDGKHYGLDLSVLSTSEFFDLQTGTRISVEGMLVPVEALSAAQWHTYDIEGIIMVASGRVIE